MQESALQSIDDRESHFVNLHCHERQWSSGPTSRACCLPVEVEHLFVHGPVPGEAWRGGASTKSAICCPAPGNGLRQRLRYRLRLCLCLCLRDQGTVPL